MARPRTQAPVPSQVRQTARAALLVRSFPPIARADAELLILGSMPGAASLAAGRYYAHPRNAFWRIMDELLGLDASATYEERTAALVSARIALWDVLQSCHRAGSLDTSIDPATQVANDFASFFGGHPRIGVVLFNGTKAWESFRRAVPADAVARTLEVVRLPSTSPANASWSFERKLDAWRAAVRRNRGQVPREKKSVPVPDFQWPVRRR